MLQISRLADYAIVIVSALSDQSELMTVEQISEQTLIPLATVRKVMRFLMRAGLVVARKGVHGGYELLRSGDEITALQVLEAVDGPIALTRCSNQGSGCDCFLESQCEVKLSWQMINQVVARALNTLSIREMQAKNAEHTSVSEKLIASVEPELNS